MSAMKEQGKKSEKCWKFMYSRLETDKLFLQKYKELWLRDSLDILKPFNFCLYAHVFFPCPTESQNIKLRL